MINCTAIKSRNILNLIQNRLSNAGNPFAKSVKTFVFIFFFFFSDSHAQNLNWLHNLDDTFESAQSEDKEILLYFSGSDWCRQCLELKKTVLDQEQFINYAIQKLVLVNADFPRRKDNQFEAETKNHFNELAEQYNPQGIFPTLLLFDSNGEVLNTFTSKNQLEKYLEGKLSEK